MFHQLQCRNLMEAHLLRSRLLEEDIESWVVNEHATTLYFESLMPPQLLIADEDWGRAENLLKEAVEPLPDDFTEPTSEEQGNHPPLQEPLPPLGASIFSFGVLWSALGVMAAGIGVTFGILDGAISLSGGQHPQWVRELFTLPFWGFMGGSVAGLILHLPLRATRVMRPDNLGRIPLAGRWVVFLVLLYFILYEFYLI